MKSIKVSSNMNVFPPSVVEGLAMHVATMFTHWVWTVDGRCQIKFKIHRSCGPWARMHELKERMYEKSMGNMIIDPNHNPNPSVQLPVDVAGPLHTRVQQFGIRIRKVDS